MVLSEHLKAAEIILNPGEKYSECKRFWQGCSSIMRTPKGNLYAAWYTGGTKEPSKFNYNVLVKSSDNGESWSEPLLVIESIPEFFIKAIDIQLWLDPTGKAWVFWVQRYDKVPNEDPRHLSTWAITSDNIDDDAPLWSEPRRISEGFLRCQPTVLNDGRYLLFAYDWTCDNYCYSESADGGLTWQRKTAGKKLKTDFDETMALERKDGSIWLLARSGCEKLAESFSYDGGQTWTDGKASSITAPASRFYITRLKSGRVLLVVNNSPVHRTMLTAFISEDDGKSWPWSLAITNKKDGVSYPDLVEGKDGWLYMVHDKGRTTDKEILFSRFKESDVLAGKLIDSSSFMCRVISKAPEKPYDQELFNQQKMLEEAKLI